MLADEPFDGGRGVDVRDGDHPVRDAEHAHLFPADLELIDGGHVGHRAPGREVRQNHLLMRRAQHVGALGHEVDAAEDDVVSLMLPGGVLRELERVAGDVGELDHLVALVVMAEDDEPIAEGGASGGNAHVELVVGETEVGVRERLALVQPSFFVPGQQLDVHRWMSWCDPSSPDFVKNFTVLRDEKGQIPVTAICLSGFDAGSVYQKLCLASGFGLPASG